MYDEYRPSVIGIESVAYQRALFLALRESQQTLGRYLPTTELRPDTDKTKEMRIFGLEPYWAARKIHFLADPAIALNQEQEVLMGSALNGQDELLDEALHFPLSEHDDLLDALSYVPHIAYPAKTQNLRRKVGNTFDSIRARALARRR